MTGHEKNLIREAVARTRAELSERVPPGDQDWQRCGPDKITKHEADMIRDYVRHVRTTRGSFRGW